MSIIFRKCGVHILDRSCERFGTWEVARMIAPRIRKAAYRALALATLIAAVATSAYAQGFYYKEVARDGRIYVFNVAANAERFEQTGELRGGITKAGVGPAGETVIGDNERALQLYFFKHGIAEVVP